MIFDDPLFLQAPAMGNEEPYLNYHGDMITSLFTSSWNVFEQITKHLTATDYSTSHRCRVLVSRRRDAGDAASMR